MTLLFIEGGDHYNSTYANKKWDAGDGTFDFAVDTTNKRFSSQNQVIGIDQFVKVLADKATLVVGFWLYVKANVTSIDSLLKFADGETTQCTLGIQNYSLAFFRGDHNGTKLSNNLTNKIKVIKTNVGNYIEVKVTINNSTGSYEVRCNGETIIAGDNQDTQQSSNAVINRLTFHEINTGGNNDSLYTDIYCCDTSGGVNNNFLGDSRISTIYPNANGNSSGFVGSDGNSTDNYLLVDDTTAPDGDSTYVATATVSTKDTYNFGSMSFTPSTIHGVQISALVRKTDAGPRTVAIVTRSGGTDYDSSNYYLGDSYDYISQIRETDPNTAAAWTQSNVNAAEFGIKLTA